MKEQDIQTRIKNKLQFDGWEVVKLIKTSHNGIPDLMALKEGKVMFIEVKTVEGKLSAIQEFRISQLRGLGFKVFIWTDYETEFKGGIQNTPK